MGKRGPKPTPTAVLKLRGSWRANRNPHEPSPEPGAQAPPWLSDEARQVWDQVAPPLAALGVLTRVDALALARYCQHFAEYLAAGRELAETGPIVERTSETGDVTLVEVPAVKRLQRLSQLMLCFEREFGLTPPSRSSVKVEPAQPTGFTPRARRG